MTPNMPVKWVGMEYFKRNFVAILKATKLLTQYTPFTPRLLATLEAPKFTSRPLYQFATFIPHPYHPNSLVGRTRSLLHRQRGQTKKKPPDAETQSAMDDRFPFPF